MKIWMVFHSGPKGPERGNEQFVFMVLEKRRVELTDARTMFKFLTKTALDQQVLVVRKEQRVIFTLRY